MSSDAVPRITPNSALKPSWNPLCCTGTDLPMNLTVMVKMLAIVLLIVNPIASLPDHRGYLSCLKSI